MGVGAPTSVDAGPRPLRDAVTVAEVETHDWPSPDDWVMGPLAPEYKSYLRPFSVLSPNIPPLFITLCELMGMDVALMNLLLAPAVVEAALVHIAEISLEVQRRAMETYGDVLHQVRLWDDIADKRGLLFQPDLWRRLFLPHLARASELAKSHGLLVHYHCCGAMSDIIPDLIDIGVDVLEPCQLHLPGMDPERLKLDYGHRITFWGGVNTQQTLPFGGPDDVRREVQERVRVLGRGGGYVLSPDHTLMPDVPPDNVTALYDEGRRCLTGQ
jgi:uroporphyrinogen decarboxylase